MDPLGSLWNQASAGPFRLAGNTLHRRRSFPALRFITWLKCSMWSYGSEEPSYIANRVGNSGELIRPGWAGPTPGQGYSLAESGRANLNRAAIFLAQPGPISGQRSCPTLCGKKKGAFCIFNHLREYFFLIVFLIFYKYF